MAFLFEFVLTWEVWRVVTYYEIFIEKRMLCCPDNDIKITTHSNKKLNSS